MQRLSFFVIVSEMLLLLLYLFFKTKKKTSVKFSGPISGPKDAEFVLQNTNGVHGFYGASSLERLPVEQAITSTVKEYKSISIK